MTQAFHSDIAQPKGGRVMRRVSKQEWENEHMHNPMTEGEALAVDAGLPAYLEAALRKVRNRAEQPRSAVHGPQFIAGLRCAANMIEEAGRRAALAAHTAASGGEVVAERHALYGIRWIKQLRNMKPGTQWFIEGRAEPIATVTSGAGVLWHMAESEIPHGTKYYTAPPSAPVGDRPSWMAEVCRCAVQAMEANGLSDRAVQLRRVADQLAALTQQPAQAAPGDDEYRLLLRGDVVQAGDEVLHDNCTRWIELAGWEIGMVYDPLVFVPVRRKAPTPPGDDAAGGGHG